MPRLAGKVAFITGAGNGIGRPPQSCSPAKVRKSPLRRSKPRPARNPLTSLEMRRSRSVPSERPRQRGLTDQRGQPYARSRKQHR